MLAFESEVGAAVIETAGSQIGFGEWRLIPATIVVALLALVTVGSLMNVVAAMATGAIGRNALVALIGVARGAQGVGMGAMKSEAGSAVVKLLLLPAGRGMAVIALFAKSLLVSIVVFVTGKAIGRCIAPMNHRLARTSRHTAVRTVTTMALGCDVATFQGEVSLSMIKQALAEPDDIGSTSLVFGVALAAFTRNG